MFRPPWELCREIVRVWTDLRRFVTVPGTSVAWLESLSPWPVDGFGTERMRALLARLGDPQRSFAAVHIVGTKGKSTAARRIARTIGGPAYTSPHVSGWHERLDTDPEGFERAIERIRADAAAVAATQFEAVTAAAFADFAVRGATVAAIEAGLGGRHDATNTIDARVVLLTNVGLEHTDVLGRTRAEIAAEKLAVAGPGSTVILARRRVRAPRGRTRSSSAARRTPLRHSSARAGRWPRRACPGRLEIRGRARSATAPTRPTPSTGCSNGFRSRTATSSSRRSSATRTRPASSTGSRRAGDTFVATTSTNPRALPAEAVADLARAALRDRPHGTRAGSRARPRARARGARARDRLALPPCRPR